MSHEKKKLHVYISLRRQTLSIMYIYICFLKYEGGSNFKSNTHVYLKYIHISLLVYSINVLYFFIDAPDYYS